MWKRLFKMAITLGAISLIGFQAVIEWYSFKYKMDGLQITAHNKTQKSNKISKQELSENFMVPSFVHVIWFYPPNSTFRFHNLLCLLSIRQHIKPKRVMFWYNNMPTGPWWRFATETLPNLYLMYKEPPTEIFNHLVSVPAHQSDITRLEILLKFGGIYLDLDVIVVKPFEPLLHHAVTMGAETPELLGNGIITAARNATFLHIWKNQYKTFDDTQWNKHSVQVPMQIAKQHPNLVHIEWFSLLRPNWDERNWLFSDGKLWDWSENLAVHLWYREYNVEHNPNSIRTWNTTAGEVMRFIYYGSTDVLR